MRRWLALGMLACGTSCGDADDGSGSGGTSGAAGAGGVASGGGPSDAGCVDVDACSACLATSCAAELAACDAVPACTAANLDRTSCLGTCVSPQNCWSVHETSAGSKASALRICAKTSCALCQP